MNIAIIGGGPAGMSCALWLKNFGYSPIMVEAESALGGLQRYNFHDNPWVLGLPGFNGVALASHLVEHFRALSLPSYLGCGIRSITRVGSGFSMALDCVENSALEVNGIVIATGTRPRGVPGFHELRKLTDRIIIGPTSFMIKSGIQKSRVLILGGGDNAFDHALYLSQYDNDITVCARGAFIARPDFIRRAVDNSAVTLHPDCHVDSIMLEGGKLMVQFDGHAEPYDFVLVMYGFTPNSEFLAQTDPATRPQIDQAGFIVVDRWQRSSIERIYAAGDVTAAQHPCVSTAVGQGAVAAKAISMDMPID